MREKPRAGVTSQRRARYSSRRLQARLLWPVFIFPLWRLGELAGRLLRTDCCDRLRIGSAHRHLRRRSAILTRVATRAAAIHTHTQKQTITKSHPAPPTRCATPARHRAFRDGSACDGDGSRRGCDLLRSGLLQIAHFHFPPRDRERDANARGRARSTRQRSPEAVIWPRSFFMSEASCST